MKYRVLAVCAALALMAAACGGADETSGTTDDVGTSTSSTTTTTTTTTEAAPDPAELSLSDFFPFAGPDNPEDAEEFYRNKEILVQEAVRDCMAGEGFEYIPYVPSNEFAFFGGEDFDQEEWAAQYGFGFTMGLLEGEDQPFGGEDFNPEDDPNFAITEEMTESEVEAYYYTLYGEQPDLDFQNATEEEMQAAWESREWKGCYETAAEQVYGGGADYESFYTEFGSALEDLYDRVQADPRIVKLQSEWSTCMAAAGFEYRDQEDMYMDLQTRFEQIVSYGDFGFEEFPFEVIENDDGSVIYVDEAGNELTQEQVDAYFAPEFDEEAVRAFRDEEIAIAVADAQCSKDFTTLFEDVYEEYEKLFVQENYDALQDWKATSSSSTP